MRNNIVPTTQQVKIPVNLVEFYLPHGDGIYKLFVNPKTLHLEAIQFWTDKGYDDELIASNEEALKLFCQDIDTHLEKNWHIPEKVWDVIKSNQFRSLWFVDGLNINQGDK